MLQRAARGAALLADDDAELNLFLMADAVGAARAGQKTPEGYYNLEQMLKRVMLGGAQVMVCGTCMAVRGVAPDELIEGSQTSNMTELAELVAMADRVLSF